jgi:transcriptional regulator NrdR family protein|tara:strand:+ start:8945 stop:9148 length:204 start_codon:yes stop_codon:yes gene_type:complete
MKIALTDKERQAYVKGGYAKCPYCESKDLEICDKNSDDNWVTHEIQCNSCEKSWTDVYELIDMLEEK